MRRIVLLTSACVTGIVLLLSGPVAAQIAEPQPAPPAPRTFPPADGPGDVNPLDRSAAFRALFAPYFDEAFKQNMLTQVANQQIRYPRQMAGAVPAAGTPVWHSLGPATDRYTENGIVLHAVDSGRMASILPNPANPQQMYVLTAGGGLWRTDNLLLRKPDWRPLSDRGTTTSGGAAAIGRTFDDVFVGLGDAFETTPALGGVMVASHNGGATFNKPISLPGASQVREVSVDTTFGKTIVLVGTDVGLFRSADGGVTYNQVTGGTGQILAGLGVWSIRQSSAGWLLTAVSPNLAIAPSSQGAVAVSTDHGATWTAIPDTTAAFIGSGRITLAVAAPGETTVYAIASNTTGLDQSDMFKSVDGGLNWTALGLASKVPTNANCDQPGMDLLNSQAYYNQSLLVDPDDATRNTVYAGGNLSLAKTVDGGTTFTIVGDWLPGGVCPQTASIPYVHADHHTSAVVRVGDHSVLAFGSDGGLFLTRNGGASFDASKNTGIVSMLTQTVTSAPDREGTVLSGLQDDGVRARIAGTTDWNQIFGGDGEGVGSSQANNRTDIISGYYLNIYGVKGGVPVGVGVGAINKRLYYAQTGLDLTDPDYFPFFTPIGTPTAAADPTGGTFFTLTGSTFYKTTNAGLDWKQLVHFANADGSPADVFRLNWDEIGVSPADQKKIAVGGAGGGAVLTTDSFHHVTYVQLNSLGLGYASYNSSAAWAPNDAVYFSSQAPTVGAVRVLKTNDFGKTWAAAVAGLPDVPVNQVIADNADATGQTLYAATWIGVYVTHDGGASWTQFGAGLPTVQISSLSISSNTHKLRAATYGRGIWEVQL